MAYINCSLCPSQALPTGKFAQHLEEFQCISKHKTYVAGCVPEASMCPKCGSVDPEEFLGKCSLEEHQWHNTASTGERNYR